MSIIRNAGFNLATSLIPVAVSLVILPTYIHAIGVERYGMVALIGALVGYFGIFDLGLSTATAQRIAATPESDLQGRRAIFWTASALNLAMGMLGALLILPVAWIYVDKGISIASGFQSEIHASLVWLVIAFPIMLLNGLLRGTMVGVGRFAELNLISLVTSILSQVTPLIVALYVSPSLVWVLPALYLTRIVALAWMLIVIAGPVLRSWVPVLDRTRVRDLLVFGGWVALSSLLTPLMASLDRYVIGSMAGLRVVGYYSLPLQIAERTTVLPSALAGAMFPRVAGADSEQARRLAVRGLRSIGAVMAPIMVAGIVILRPLMDWWIGSDFAANAALCGQILLMAYWWNGLGIACHSWLLAIGKARAVTACHMAEVLPYFAALFAGLYWFGLAGAAAALVLRMALDAYLLARVAGLGGEILRLSLIAAAVFSWAFFASLPQSGLSLIHLAVGAATISLGGVIALGWLWHERQALLAVFRR